METLLVWAFVIAVLAIASMLALLLASERELKRARLELDALKSKLKNSDQFTARRIPLVDENAGSSSDVARWAEQARASEIAMANMQCELEAVRAENSWLKRRSAVGEPNGAVLGEPLPRSPASTRTVSGAFPLDLNPRRARVLSVSAAALLLIALASVFFVRDRSSVGPALRRSESIGPERAISAGAANARKVVDPSEAGAPQATDEPKPRLKDDEPNSSAAPRTAPQKGTAYEVVRSTRVFSEPHQRSQALARIEAGMEIVVVGARNGWLEVRSRHGRPPGFIPKDTAVRKR